VGVLEWYLSVVLAVRDEEWHGDVRDGDLVQRLERDVELVGPDLETPGVGEQLTVEQLETIGSGLAGAATAILLADRGVAVDLIDIKPDGWAEADHPQEQGRDHEQAADRDLQARGSPPVVEERSGDGGREDRADAADPDCGSDACGPDTRVVGDSGERVQACHTAVDEDADDRGESEGDGEWRPWVAESPACTSRVGVQLVTK